MRREGGEDRTPYHPCTHECVYDCQLSLYGPSTGTGKTPGTKSHGFDLLT